MTQSGHHRSTSHVLLWVRREPAHTKTYFSLDRRIALTFPLLPPPQKNVSLPLDSRPDTATPGGMSICSRTSPLCGSILRSSLSSDSHVPCHSSPSTQVTTVTKRFDSMVRRIAPVCGST